MPEQYYKDAQRAGIRRYRKRVSRGEYPYLPVLDSILSEERLTSAIDLGICSIPAEFVVGTRTSGRTNAFADNFMPLLDSGTEFSIKWERLCSAHMEEGIRDPIKVYEFMNRYYVEEGNKRASVLKFFGAVSISAHVYRIMPKNRDVEETRRYDELLEFSSKSHINFIEFSQSGRYKELLRCLGKTETQEWTEDETKQFSSVYYYFRQVYQNSWREQLSITAADAMLAYMKIFGYQSMIHISEKELKKNLNRVWEDLTLQQDAEPICISATPDEEKKPGIIDKVYINTVGKVHNIAFIHDKTPELSGWTNSHELGRQHVQLVFGKKIQTTAYFNAVESSPEKVIEKAIAEGNTVIFTTSSRLLPASIKVAVQHPEVTILNCSVNISHRYIRTYYARMYEVKFIAGAIAGALSKNDRIGYICNYPIYGNIAGINAFALGAQMINPDVKIYLEWSSVNGIRESVKKLVEQDIHLISSIESVPLNDEDYNLFGLFQIDDNEKTTLAVPLWQWGVYYESIIRRILDRTFYQEYEGSHKAMNYYWGMSAGVVDLFCEKSLPKSTQKLEAFLKESISSGKCNPFMGPITTQDGTVIETENDLLSLEQIVNMDYLVENVVGMIPVYEEMDDTARTTVDQVGVEKATRKN